MAQNKKSFVAYCDWLDSFEELSDEEAGKLVKHLFRYVNDKNPDAPDKLTKLCFIPIQQSLKRDLKKYEAYVKKQSENGAKGGRPPKPTEPKKPNALFENPNEPKKADSVSVSANGSDNANEIKENDFDIFWKAFNYNVGQRQTQDEWFSIIKEMPNEIAKILVHVPKYVLSKPDKKYRKKPENYLKERIWQDEIEELNNEAKKDIPVHQRSYDERVKFAEENGIKLGSAQYNRLVNKTGL